MITFAFCHEQESELEYMRDEVAKCLRQKGIKAALRCYHNAYEFEQSLCCNCPDILFYDLESQNGLMREVALAAKRRNKNLVSVVTRPPGCEVHANETAPLEPLYTMPDQSRNYLWSYTVLAYETLMDGADSFLYYVRPDYVHVPVEDIRYFASEGRRTHVVCNGCRDSFYRKLDEVERYIQGKNGHFLRIHKSYLVNADYISGYCRDYVTLTTGERLRISKYEYYRMLNERFREEKLNPA